MGDYAGVDTYPATIPLADDGDDLDAASVTAAEQGNRDAVVHLHNRLGGVTDVGTLLNATLEGNTTITNNGPNNNVSCEGVNIAIDDVSDLGVAGPGSDVTMSRNMIFPRKVTLGTLISAIGLILDASTEVVGYLGLVGNITFHGQFIFTATGSAFTGAQTNIFPSTSSVEFDGDTQLLGRTKFRTINAGDTNLSYDGTTVPQEVILPDPSTTRAITLSNTGGVIGQRCKFNAYNAGTQSFTLTATGGPYNLSNQVGSLRLIQFTHDGSVWVPSGKELA